MILNRQQKENLVIELLNQGVSVPQIAKQAHVSFTDIKKIRQKLTGEAGEEQKQEDQKKKPLSIPSQAFKLFLEGKSIVKVAIELDLPTDNILKIHSDYLILQNMERASRVLTENRKNLDAYLGLFDFVNGNNIKANDLNQAVHLAQNMSNLRKVKAQLEYDLDMLMDTKKWYEQELEVIKNKYYKIR
jgi:hypothetical protein